MRVIKPPEKVIQLSKQEKFLFLAGSIEMGKAEDWQKRVESILKDTDWTILNPRRDNWDSSWTQSIHNEQFREQVLWELSGLDLSDKILFYFSPNTMSPITLLELGVQAGNGKDRLIVCCPDGFWRQGNVEIVCLKYRLTFLKKLDQAIDLVLKGKNEK